LSRSYGKTIEVYARLKYKRDKEQLKCRNAKKRTKTTEQTITSKQITRSRPILISTCDMSHIVTYFPRYFWIEVRRYPSHHPNHRSIPQRATLTATAVDLPLQCRFPAPESPTCQPSASFDQCGQNIHPLSGLGPQPHMSPVSAGEARQTVHAKVVPTSSTCLCRRADCGPTPAAPAHTLETCALRHKPVCTSVEPATLPRLRALW
jgi:hypothetical protein